MVLKSLEIVSSLLEPAERQSVLGDVQERGPNFRALLDLVGLVLLRQLQAWKSWRTWLLAASLLLPAFAVVNGAHAVADTASFYPWPGLTEFSRPDFALMIFNSTIAIIVLAWVTGYTLGALARHRAFALLLPLALCPVLLLSMPFAKTWHHAESAALVLSASALLALGPALFGLRRGWNRTPLQPRTAIVLGLMCLPFALLLPNSRFWSTQILNVVAFWPAVYAVIPARKGAYAH